jgi:hypothetical protein
MSLGKLLAAGKSFVNGRGAVAYRKNRRVYLPKFSAPKNPFTPSVQAELPEPPVENSIAPVKSISAPVTEKISQPTISIARKFPTVWASKLNPMTMLRGSQGKTKGAPHPAVQAELSLDSVKVVHNDLSDAEVEVVPIKSRPANEFMARADSDENSWSRLSAKFFGSNPA